ncbi:MAG: AAA family ATPase [Bdellovibrionota bacterium]
MRSCVVFVVLLSLLRLSEAGPLRPFFYFFSNGAQLSIKEGQLIFTPSGDDLDGQAFTEKIAENSLMLVPETMSQNATNPNATVLNKSEGNALVLQTPSAEAVPLMWRDESGISHLAFITQEGSFFYFDHALANSDAFPYHPVSFSYRILPTSESDYVIIANVGKSGDALAVNKGHPWVISSSGESHLLNFEIPTSYVFTYDEVLRKAFFEKAKPQNLLEIGVDRVTQFSHAKKREIPAWDGSKKYRPRFSVVLSGNVEWNSESQGRAIHLKAPLVLTSSDPKAPNVKRTLSPIPDIQVESGNKIKADKLLFEFAHKYTLSDIPDYGFHTQEFRPLAVSLFADPAGSIVVTGESGGGKTTYVEAFTRAILSGQFADKGIDPSNTEVIHFSSSSLTSGTTLRSAEEAKIEAIIKYAEWAHKNGITVIFFIDEIHTLTSSGTSHESSNDVFHSFLGPLAKGHLKIVGTTTNDNYLTIAARPDLERRLPPYAYKPITEAEVPARLEMWIAAHGKENLSQKYLSYVSQLAIEFDSSGEPISRAARLLGRIYTEAKFDGIEIASLETNPQYALDVAARFYGYNVQNFTVETLDTKIAEIDEKLGEIVGFEGIKEKIKDFHIRTVSRSRLADKPEGRFLMISPKGLGKSTTVSAVADALGRPYVRIALSAYSDREMLYSDIARAAKKNPYSVILFDELGDAPRDIIAALNSALDAQKISADINYGKSGTSHLKTTIDLGRTLVFAATNSGATLIEEAYKNAHKAIGFSTAEIEKDPEVKIDIEALKNRAIAEGLFDSLTDRFEIVPVLYYTREKYEKILSIHYDRMFRKLNERNQLDVSLDAAAKEGYIIHLMKKYFLPTASPRAAIKELDETIENYFAYLKTKDVAPAAAAQVLKSCKALLSR